MEKYFIQNNTTGYLVQIFDANFTGISTEIHGKISFDKGSVNNILDTIRGTGLHLQLEANPLLTFDEFSEADEKTYTVIVKKSGQIVFKGFLKPDGVTQSFVRDIWYVSLDFIDGLGALKDLSFVKSNGFNFVGKISMLEVIEACLNRTGVIMTINTSIDVHYLDYIGTNILRDTYVNSDRFFKIDDDTIMSCEEVMNSILNLFSACITQQDGQWWIYRPNDFIGNTATFIDNSFNTTFVKNLYLKIGSQIDNFYPHHCNGNQQIQTKGAISAYRINYKYGYVSGLLNNNKFVHNTAGVYEGWTILNYDNLIPNPLTEKGISFKDTTFLNSTVSIKSDNYLVSQGDLFSFKLNVDLYKQDGTAGGKFFKCIIRCGSYTLKYSPANNETPIDDASNALWVTGTQKYVLTLFGQSNIDVSIPAMPVDGVLTVEIIGFTPWLTFGGISHISLIDIIPKGRADGIVGEFHTVSRNVAPSSITKENQEVYNGDNNGIIYLGALFKPDKITNTTLWTRKGKFEEYPLLRISAEDDMRIQQKPTKIFTGDIYGYVPYLSVIEINNISGKFMFTEHSYDTENNITSGKLLQFFTNEVADLDYLLTFDYGKTVKPTIV